MHWYVADKDYVKYLKSFDNKVQEIEYGDNFKPYFGIVFQVGDFNYYCPISSPKTKHNGMSNGKDFHKIIIANKLVAVVNINNMIPIPDAFIDKLNYAEVHLYKSFSNDAAKNKYIDLLQNELKEITSVASIIKKNATELRAHKSAKPETSLSKRCCEFALLEEKSKEYGKK